MLGVRQISLAEATAGYVKRYAKRSILEVVPRTSYKGFCFDIAQFSCVKQLDKKSEASNFFGVNCIENLGKCLQNHGKLNKLAEVLLNCKTLGMSDAKSENYEYHNCIKNNKMPEYKSVLLKVPELSKDILSAARITFRDAIFKGFHTLGFVRSGENIYVLDSLGNKTDKMKDFHKDIELMIKNCGVKNIIVNDVIQQSLCEYTCNNWTYANIEAVLKALRSGVKIESSEQLSAVLPKNINEILEKQMKLVKGV